MTIVEARPVAAAVTESSATVLPAITPRAVPPHNLRAIRGWHRDDVLTLVGSAVSAYCTARLLFGLLAPLQGILGFVAVTFALFIVIYALLVSITEDRPAVVDRVMSVLMASCALIAGGALASVVISTFWKGHDVLVKSNLYLEDMSTTGPLDPLSKGGISHAIVGSLIIMSLSLLVTVPLGLTTAVYLNENRGRLSRVVRTVVDAMTALPSIVAGLFIFATFILILGFQRSGLAASLAISLMMLPIIVRSSDVVLRLVPGNLREASAALGATQWRTVWFVVLPTARAGLVTSVILGVARGVGETAPVMLTSGVTATMNLDLSKNPMMSLPLAAFQFVLSPEPKMVQRGFATAAVLMSLVLTLFVVARILGGRPVGHLSKRGAQRTRTRSARDLARFEARTKDVV